MEQEDQTQELEGTAALDYQLDRHCSKTYGTGNEELSRFDYQLDRHCSKTHALNAVTNAVFDYQLDRHCSKTTRT